MTLSYIIAKRPGKYRCWKSVYFCSRCVVNDSYLFIKGSITEHLFVLAKCNCSLPGTLIFCLQTILNCAGIFTMFCAGLLNLRTLLFAGVEYEANWPNVLLENHFPIGDITGIAINSAGNIILLHRGSYKFKDTDFRWSPLSLAVILHCLIWCYVCRKLTEIYGSLREHDLSTLCLKKNIPNVFSCNLRKHWQIFIIFGRNVTVKASNHMLLYFSTSPN